MQIQSARDRKRARQKVKCARYWNSRHRGLRAQLVPFVEAGLARCARCGEPIEPGSRWHLGHDDLDPSRYNGPEHAWCNERAPHLNKTSRQW